jgi:hypothetical protein
MGNRSFELVQVFIVKLVYFSKVCYWSLQKEKLCVNFGQVGGVSFFQAWSLAFGECAQHSVPDNQRDNALGSDAQCF